MNLIIYLLCELLQLYMWLIIATVLVSWLVAFDVLNTRNKLVYKALKLLNRAVDPPMAKLRKILPPVGGIDFTPMVLMFGIYFAQNFLQGLARY